MRMSTVSITTIGISPMSETHLFTPAATLTDALRVAADASYVEAMRQSGLRTHQDDQSKRFNRVQVSARESLCKAYMTGHGLCE